MSDTERVKSVCWRGSPDPLQRPRSTGCWEKVSTEPSRGRARLAVVHIDQVEETTLSKVVEPPVQSPPSTRTEWALGRGSCPSRTHRVVRTMLAGGEELHQPGGRLRGRSCSRVRSLRLCVPRPPAHHGPTVLARSVHAYRYRAVGGSVPRGRPPAVPRGRAAR